MTHRACISRETSNPVNDALKSLLALLTLSALIVATNARADNVNGAWSQVYDWPLISVHAALTPDGRVLTYGTNGDGKQTGYFIYDIWDPAYAPDAGHVTLSNMTLTDIFCSSNINARRRLTLRNPI